MIKEIAHPLETIQEFLAKRRASKKTRKKFKTSITEYDVFFKEDVKLIQELADRCGIDYELAERFATVVFEEIKKVLIEGEIIKIPKFGTFYLNGPHHNSKHEIVIPKERYGNFLPKFKAAVLFKKYIANVIKKKANNDA